MLSWTQEQAEARAGAPDEELLIPIRHEADLLTARQRGRALASSLRFSSSELTLIATAISEVARNILSYAGTGEILLRLVQKGSRRGIVVVARDHGPGIADISLAMQDGYSTAGSLGLGLPGAKRLMDEFNIVSEVGEGTAVTMSKWEH
ncbi:MAG: anti-sigma regulatory factor [Telluria sp.]|nr:anti-sigma regulatory factor [Telluria sp.]